MISSSGLPGARTTSPYKKDLALGSAEPGISAGDELAVRIIEKDMIHQVIAMVWKRARNKVCSRQFENVRTDVLPANDPLILLTASRYRHRQAIDFITPSELFIGPAAEPKQLQRPILAVKRLAARGAICRHLGFQEHAVARFKEAYPFIAYLNKAVVANPGAIQITGREDDALFDATETADVAAHDQKRVFNVAGRQGAVAPCP